MLNIPSRTACGQPLQAGDYGFVERDPPPIPITAGGEVRHPACCGTTVKPDLRSLPCFMIHAERHNGSRVTPLEGRATARIATSCGAAGTESSSSLSYSNAMVVTASPTLARARS